MTCVTLRLSSVFAFYLVVALCYGQSTTPRVNPSVTAIRLVNGSSSRDGRVEVQFGGEWGTICDDGWTLNDALVACRMVGFAAPVRNIMGSSGIFPPGPNSTKVLLRAVQCIGTEQTLAGCSFQLNNGVCLHNQDAGVFCLGDVISTTTTTTPRPSTTTLPSRICTNPRTNIRLVRGNGTITTDTGEGRVQVLYNNTWKSICDDLWGVQDAQVVCRMLCFNPANARAILGGGGQTYGNATEGYWLTEVQCTGAEDDINTCTHPSYGSTARCSSIEAAGVSCLADTPTVAPLPSPDMNCSSETITAKFLRSRDPLLQPQHLSVSPSSGQPINCSYGTAIDNSYVSISIPFIGNCNTSRQTNDTHISYTNIVRYAVPSPSSIITRTEIYYITVYCVMPKAADPNNGFDPIGRTVPPQPGSGNYNVQLILFQDSHFQNPISSSSSPIQVTLGDWVYAGAQLYSSDASLKLVLADCFVSQSSQLDGMPQYYLIRNKCPVEATVTQYPINSTLSGFRFQSFRFVTNTSNVMYMHCHTYSCALTDKTGYCDTGCNTAFNAIGSSSRRRRRDVAADYVRSAAFFVVDVPADVAPFATAATTALSGRPRDTPASLEASSSVSALTSHVLVLVTFSLTSLLLLLSATS